MKEFILLHKDQIALSILIILFARNMIYIKRNNIDIYGNKFHKLEFMNIYIYINLFLSAIIVIMEIFNNEYMQTWLLFLVIVFPVNYLMIKYGEKLKYVEIKKYNVKK